MLYIYIYIFQFSNYVDILYFWFCDAHVFLWSFIKFCEFAALGICLLLYNLSILWIYYSLCDTVLDFCWTIFNLRVGGRSKMVAVSQWNHFKGHVLICLFGEYNANLLNNILSLIEDNYVNLFFKQLVLCDFLAPACSYWLSAGALTSTWINPTCAQLLIFGYAAITKQTEIQRKLMSEWWT